MFVRWDFRGLRRAWSHALGAMLALPAAVIPTHHLFGHNYDKHEQHNVTHEQ